MTRTISIQVGLLPKGNAAHLPFAYAFYKKATTPEGEITALKFNHAMSRKVQVDFLGVWWEMTRRVLLFVALANHLPRDTVASVGVTGRILPFAARSYSIKIFRQALALDERRRQFRPNPWRTKYDPELLALAAGATTESLVGHELRQPPRPRNDSTLTSSEGEDDGLPSFLADWRKFRLQMINPIFAWGDGLYRRTQETDFRDAGSPEIMQVSSSHGSTVMSLIYEISCEDVGGGSQPQHDYEPSISNPSLLWMVQQVEIARIGIVWAHDAFKSVPTIRDYLRPPREVERTRLGDLSEGVLELLKEDACQPIHDKLSKPWSPWWALECLPSWSTFFKYDGRLHRRLG